MNQKPLLIPKFKLLDPFANMIPKSNKHPELKPVVVVTHNSLFQTRSADALRYKASIDTVISNRRSQKELRLNVNQTDMIKNFSPLSPSINCYREKEKIRFKISDEKLPKLPKLRQNLGKGTINVRKIEFDGTFGLGAK
jgi:hypothetical protein